MKTNKMFNENKIPKGAKKEKIKEKARFKTKGYITKEPTKKTT